MISKETDKAREMFMAIAIVEHHISPLAKYSTYDLCEIFEHVWKIIEKEAKHTKFALDISSVMTIHSELCNSVELEIGNFLNEEEWKNLIDECGDEIEEDPGHVISWIFSSLYWDHLTQLKLITAWLYTNALRVQQGLPIFRLSVGNIGDFLDSLSGSGPPIHDGQTFFPDTYS